ncbi:MAG: hypothetical protein QF903_07625 [Planctomycetota bacterium]|jgi:hypothetical protein|nr:hypothetical protein [Planctomycetota bacterium]MDP6762028.1 hypothetical protein [Planctomycetota bacterium]MDP6989334.1 hypothetical protein [Planctomycetota bacterium]
MARWTDRRLALAVLAAGVAVGSFSAAAGGRHGPTVDPSRGDPVELASNDGTYFLAYTLEATTIPESEPFALEVGVFADEARKLPAAGIELAFDARMPQHGHGMRREPRVSELGEGRYRVEGILLHMPGYWELYFDVTRGPITERAQDSLVVD